MKTIDITQWERKALYDNFTQFEDPFFNICADVEITPLHAYCQSQKASFFICSYYALLRVANRIEAFRYRIRGGQVVLHEKIRGSCPIMRADDTFGYGYFDYEESLACFSKLARAEIGRVKTGGVLETKFDEDDLIHSSVIPWVSFRSIAHAKRLGKGDSIPKIVMGKPYDNRGKTYMPLSVSGHHALMDGLHAGIFFQDYEKLCLACESWLASGAD